MARKPGIHKSTIYSLKSHVLGKYIMARAWEYQGSNDYKVRHMSINDHPISIAKSRKTAEKLRSMLPDHIRETIVNIEDRIDAIRRDLDNDRTQGGRYIKYHEERIERGLAEIKDMAALLTNPIDIVMIETTTETKETVV